MGRLFEIGPLCIPQFNDIKNRALRALGITLTVRTFLFNEIMKVVYQWHVFKQLTLNAIQHKN